MPDGTPEQHVQISLPNRQLAKGITPPPRLITRGQDNGLTPDSPARDSLMSPLSALDRGNRRKGSRATLHRSTSSNSPLYMIKSHKVKVEPLPFECASHDEEFETLTSTVLEKQSESMPTVWQKSWFRLLYLFLILSGVYFGLVGWPLWDGSVVWFWRWYQGDIGHHHIMGLVAFLLAGLIRSILPQFLCTFDRVEPSPRAAGSQDVSECCVIIPCHKAADALRSTLPACLAIFKPEQIFVIANGNSPTPLDNTEQVCGEYGVRHVWLPVGSKITAEFVAVQLAKEYKYCLLIDDDVLLPPNLHMATEAFGDEPAKRKVACVAYAIKSVGAGSSRGTLIQQAQDLEYKLAGLLKVFQSDYGSVVFPHGAIALWRRDVLESLLHAHPGYSISEDWWLGHTARAAGYRIAMTSSIFVETETPPNLFPSLWATKSRAGYGEMSVVQQRFYRWSFFYVFRIWANTSYLVLSWRLGWRELITKLFVFGECYDTLAKLVSPIVLPVTLAANWRLTCIIWFGVVGFNVLLACWFNLVHLGLLRRKRDKNEQVAWAAFPAYVVLKFAMMFVNAAGIYWSVYQYAIFFTRQHLRVTESVPAWRVIRANARGNSAGSPGGCMV